MNTKTDSTGVANWFVGASYGGTDDQMPQFIAEKIWDNCFFWGVTLQDWFSDSGTAT